MKRIKLMAVAIAVPTAAVIAAGAYAVYKLRERKRRREREEKGHKMPEQLRSSIEELLSLQRQDFVPDGLGKSMYQRKLATMPDYQLIALYALVKAVEVLRNRGSRIQGASKEERHEAVQQFHAMLKKGNGRKKVLAELGSFGFEMLHEILKDGMLLVSA